jgi:uncharacterized protein YqfA (UPF0365 family)
VTPTLIDIVVVFIINYLIFFILIPTQLWIQTLTSGVMVPLMSLIGMRLRRTDPYKIVLPLIKARKAGVQNLDANKLEAHFLAGGHPDQLVDALILAHQSSAQLSFEQLANADLTGQDVVASVQALISSKIGFLEVLNGDLLSIDSKLEVIQIDGRRVLVKAL